MKDDNNGKCQVIHEVVKKNTEVGVVLWIRWTDGTKSNDSRMEAVTVGKHSGSWRDVCSHLGTRLVQV
jgi:hypothetical protein